MQEQYNFGMTWFNRCQALVIGGGTAGCAMASKLSAKLGKNNTIVLDPATVYKCLKLNYSGNFKCVSMPWIGALLSTDVHVGWRWNERIVAMQTTHAKCAALWFDLDQRLVRQIPSIRESSNHQRGTHNRIWYIGHCRWSDAQLW